MELDLGRQMTVLDYGIVVAYLVVAIAIGIWMSRRASRSIRDYFAAGSQLPWWLAGTSMVATTFASDTPLAVTGLVRERGIFANWFWWNAALANLLGAFFFATLWRRSGVLTDLEFIGLRYGGAPATALRVFRVLFSSLIVNSIVMGWVIRAMVKIIETTFGWDPHITLAVLISIAFCYTVTAGLWGVILTDLLQFAMAMAGAIWLAVSALQAVGGATQLVEGLSLEGLSSRMNLVPSPQQSEDWFAFLVFLLVQWWAVGRPDGEGYIAQRVLASRGERDAALSFLWFSFAHYVLRPWWWILVALASLVLIPQLPEGFTQEQAYPAMMSRLLPTGVLGLMIASLLAAFMSTIDTHINWAASYLVNDLYRPYFKRNAPTSHYVLVGRLATVLVLALGVGCSLVTEKISAAWMLLSGLNAGIGLVSILRWFWWRINAWSEIAAMTAALLVNILVFLFAALGWEPFPYLATDQGFAARLLIIVPVTQVAWILVTWKTPPEPLETLVAFYRKVRPPGWWASVAEKAGLTAPRWNWEWVYGWVGGLLSLYGALFLVGGLWFGQKRGVAGGLLAMVPGILGLRVGLKALARLSAESSPIAPDG
ncbi:MAG: Na+:solute symporter [Armatimonadetes bacterium]|nr:Na+:solute symporter [Armatimonadota bacterium]